MKDPLKPTLRLTPGRGMAAKDLAALFEQLTGRKVTPEEMEELEQDPVIKRLGRKK